MLSILIPTYNYNVYPLASKLVDLAVKENIDFELICIDDGSNSSINLKNEHINKLKYSKFITHKKNLGLSHTRNALIKASKYEYLLFIDGDSLIIDEHFIKNYLNTISNDVDIIYGGRIHPQKEPAKDRKLRWKYGKYIEDKTNEVRIKNRYRTLLFNNTLIKKSCFNLIQFDNSIDKYGHEDTLYAYGASKLNFNIKHINNPIEHGDIDTNIVFLRKTELGLINLLKLYELKKVESKFVRLLSFYSNLKTLGLIPIISISFKILKPHLKQNLLKSSNPSLFLYNVYKVGILCELNKSL